MIVAALNIGSLFMLGWLIQRVTRTDLPAFVFWVALSLKLMAGILLGYIFYEFYGSGDTIHFFESAKNSSLPSNEPRTHFFLKLLKPAVWISNDSYWITSLWLSFLSFISTWYGLSVLIRLFPKEKIVLTVSMLFIPSVVFWSSGIMKDTIAFGALMIAVPSIMALLKSNNSNWLNAAAIILTCFILLKIKHYLLISVALFGGIFLAYEVFRRFKSKRGIGISAALLVITVISIQFVHPYLNLNRLPWVLYENNQSILLNTEATSSTGIVLENPDWESVLSNIPEAAITGFFRPHLNDSTPPFGYIHRIENFVLGALIAMSTIILLRKRTTIDRPVVLAASCSILLLAILLPLSTPNFGTLVRYKNAYMPFLFMLFGVLPFHFLSSKEPDK